jgi:2-oxoglutarate dehydrogenase E2 component (dihydrolipoamide succinyltransferase)
MSLEIKIPSVGESITSGLLSTWHKNDGDAVAAGEALLTLETDKVSTEIQAEKAGTLHIGVAAGSEVKIGDVVGTIEEGTGGGPGEEGGKGREKSGESRSGSRIDS